jgi:hypothetical protein
MKKRLFYIILIFAMVSVSCKTLTGGIPTSEPKTTPQSLEGATSSPTQENLTPQVTLTPPAGVYSSGFAAYPSHSVKETSASVSSYTLPVNLNEVSGLDQFSLSDPQKALLSQNGFVVTAPVAGQYREFYQVYESGRYEVTPLFVTTDSVFHTYHLLFDKMLRDLEKEYFMTDLTDLTTTLVKASNAEYQSVKGTSLEEPARRNVAYFAVAAQLLGLTDLTPSYAADLTNQEISLIEGHAGVAISPIWDRDDLPEDQKLIEDYSQYIPRGHYTRSEDLKRYFKTMMWYGRMTLRLRDSFETQRALLITNLMQTEKDQKGRQISQVWHNIYDPTVFIVGKSDDLSFQEYGVLAQSVFGQAGDLMSYADDAKVKEFMTAARQLPAPQVNSMWVWITEDKTQATQGFRMMGQRFTLDEYVFGQMIWRNVGTESSPRGLPKALDFFSALGSKEASQILTDSGETKYENYDSQMKKVTSEISALEMDSWTQNIYWSWLYALQPLIQAKDSSYPAFMQTQAWALKDLQTALGSWTELKHDTILYAKQVMAEMGGGPGEEPPHGYVEPNAEAYARLRSLAEMTQNGLSARNLLSPTTATNLQNLTDLLSFLQTISEKERSGETITAEEYERIRYIGGEFEALTLAAADRENDDSSYRDLNDQKAALIADVATGITADDSLVALEEAIGQPTVIYVVCPDKPYRIALGAVYTYYEFPVSVSDRLTDEQWQAKVEAGTTPQQPDWTNTFVAP